MENRSFNQVFLEWEEARKQLVELLNKKPKGTPVSYKAHQKQIDLHKRKLLHLNNKLVNYGSGSAILITGTIVVYTPGSNRSDTKMGTRKTFELLLVNTDLESSEKYLKVLIEKDDLFVFKETIKYKELQTGKIIIIN